MALWGTAPPRIPPCSLTPPPTTPFYFLPLFPCIFAVFFRLSIRLPAPSYSLPTPPRFIFPPLCPCCRLPVSSSPNSVPFCFLLPCSLLLMRPEHTPAFSENSPTPQPLPSHSDTKIASSNQFVCCWVTLRWQSLHDRATASA